MLKLTLNDEAIMYVLPRALYAMWRRADKSFTCIQVDNAEYVVQETPEQILAMPEMQYELYPSMLVAKEPINPEGLGYGFIPRTR
jgi:hypothetical protein